MEEQYSQILSSIGEDPQRKGLRQTPHRAAEAMRVLTKGYSVDLDVMVNGALFPSEADELVLVKNIELYSLCEHHLLPFFGKCHIGYIPDGKIIGLSKMARFVEAFARRLQVQENLTMQIADAVQHYTGAKGVGVVIEAQHLCMMMRGVEKQNSMMTTSRMLGTLKSDLSARSEFLSLLH